MSTEVRSSRIEVCDGTDDSDPDLHNLWSTRAAALQQPDIRGALHGGIQLGQSERVGTLVFVFVCRSQPLGRRCATPAGRAGA